MLSLSSADMIDLLVNGCSSGHASSNLNKSETKVQINKDPIGLKA